MSNARPMTPAEMPSETQPNPPELIEFERNIPAIRMFDAPIEMQDGSWQVYGPYGDTMGMTVSALRGGPYPTVNLAIAAAEKRNAKALALASGPILGPPSPKWVPERLRESL
ncbi:hypothetical protein [Gemmatimonas sp.]|uniref:hypothetical protein n=1 Tax=Gemmatimonas sp. TaxID=1962908 RepID=UPI003563FD53